MWQCPRCKASVRIFAVQTTVIAHADSTDVDGDMEWDDSNEAECTSCDWKGTAGEAYEE